MGCLTWLCPLSTLASWMMWASTLACDSKDGRYVKHDHHVCFVLLHSLIPPDIHVVVYIQYHMYFPINLAYLSYFLNRASEYYHLYLRMGISVSFHITLVHRSEYAALWFTSGTSQWLFHLWMLLFCFDLQYGSHSSVSETHPHFQRRQCWTAGHYCGP